MADNSVTTPNFVGTVDQNVFIEPIGGPQHPQNYLDRFPEEIYNKNVDSHLVKFMYTLLGPAGIGWLRKSYMEARLALEEMGIDLFDLDSFYANPLRFSRILEEEYEQSPSDLLPQATWEAIRSKNAAYRARALDYVRGLRAGNTPLGIKLVARSGLGHDVEVAEQYRYLFDRFSDEPLGLTNFGQTTSTEEFTIIPRRAVAQSEIQRVVIKGTPTGGTFNLRFRAKTTVDLAYNTDRETVRTALSNIDEIGPGNIEVLGGPLPNDPIEIYFQRDLANRDVPELVLINGVVGPDVTVFIETVQGGVDGTDEVGTIGPSDQHRLQEALDHIRPQTSLLTYAPAAGVQKRILWSAATSNSEFAEVVRYVTGRSDISWPTVDSIHWIEAAREHEGRRISSDRQHHYTSFHNVEGISAYREVDLPEGPRETLSIFTDLIPNEHIGPYTSYQSVLFPPLSTSFGSDYKASATRALADYAEPLEVTTQTDSGMGLINGIYPTDYQNLPGMQQIRYDSESFWSSQERDIGEDVLEIAFNEVKVINYITFETLRKPISIRVEFDTYDQSPIRRFEFGLINRQDEIGVSYAPSFTNPWETITAELSDRSHNAIYSRFLRIRISRLNIDGSPFSRGNNTFVPSSVEIRNLRIGRQAMT
jgi:hypothetical protein